MHYLVHDSNFGLLVLRETSQVEHIQSGLGWLDAQLLGNQAEQLVVTK